MTKRANIDNQIKVLRKMLLELQIKFLTMKIEKFEKGRMSFEERYINKKATDPIGKG